MRAIVSLFLLRIDLVKTHQTNNAINQFAGEKNNAVSFEKNKNIASLYLFWNNNI